MFKKLLVFVCVLALAVGVFSMTAAAEAKADENAFKAGYAKVDINPWWSVWTATGGEIPYTAYDENNIMPLPMDGYSTGIYRLALPTLSDDNGDGHITAGINSAYPGDGLQATCIAMQKGSNTLLLIAVDMLRVDDSWSEVARDAVYKATGVPVGNIMISASHTHGGVDMDMRFDSFLDTTYTVEGCQYTGAQIRDYRDAYITYVQTQLVAAAETAIENAVAVTAKRGTIQANEESGKALNSVRHYKQTETYTYQEKNWIGSVTSSETTTTTYVRGSNFNLDMNGNGSGDTYFNYSATTTKPAWGNTTTAYTWSTDERERSTPVSTADDSLHLLELKPVNGGDSIVLVNWRAHAHTGTKQENHYLSSDYVGSLRRDLEVAGYLPAFFQGASGNLDNFDNSAEATAWYRTGAATHAQRSVNYGTVLADVALALLDNTGTAITAPMAEVATGEIRTQNVPYSFTGRTIAKNEYDAAVEHLAGTNCSRTNGTYPCAHTVDGETYVFASAYHASSVKEIYGYGTWSHAADINVLTVGDALAFVTAPFELFDRYSMDATLATANNDNDWDDLAKLGFGTPFVLTCTNEYWKYVPNHLAYNYGVDEIATYDRKDTFALGCYESQTAYAVDGTGEALLEIYKRELTALSAITADCECCDTTNAQWLPLTREHLLSGELSDGHYYLRDDLTYEGVVTISDTVCLDLHGQTYTAYNSADFARFDIKPGGVLNVTDSQGQGSIVGTGKRSSVSTQLSGGAILVQSGGELNLYDGTLTFEQKDTHTVFNGGVMTVQGTFNMHGGTVEGGTVTQYGGNIFVDGEGTMHMYGGTITGGTAESVGGNIMIGRYATFEMRGGQITGGTASTKGQSVYAIGTLILAEGNEAEVEIEFAAVPTEKLFIDGTYTGIATFIMPGDRVVDEVIGSGINHPDISGAQITIEGHPDIYLSLNDDNKLVVAEVVYPASIAGQRFTTVQAAADAWWQMHNPAPIQLEPAAEDSRLSLNLTVDIKLDLNGVQPAALTVNGTGKVLCMDSTTDDYTVDGETYGQVPAGNGIQAADGYMMIKEDDMVSFHKVQNKLYSINLRPSNASLYYGSRFAGDEVVKANVKEYGIALRIGNAPTEGYITGDTEKKFHVAFDQDEWVTGTDTNSSYGVLLYGIMKPGDSSNALYATANIYGATYIKTADEQMHLSEAKVFTLKQVVEMVNGMWNSLDPLTQQPGIVDMYKQYEDVMRSWDIGNIKTAAGEAVDEPVSTDNTLKILAIGNSFSNDTTRLLEIVAEAEGYENVVIGNLYQSGCTLQQHVEFAQNPDEKYQCYYKNENGEWTERWNDSSFTLLEGLQDEDWDIITMQQGSVHSGLPQWYEEYLTQLIAYVNENKTNPNAKLFWNMTWAYQGDSTHEYFYLYNNDQMTMYNAIIGAVREKVVPHGEFSYIIPAGTAIQNARTSYIGDNLTRDGYHLNDLGRVITSYTWYCALTGIDQLDEIKLNAIPAALTNAPVFDTDRVLTDIEKNVIMEAVNNALANPMRITQSQYTQAPTN